jgi:hypothetical protein
MGFKKSLWDVLFENLSVACPVTKAENAPDGPIFREASFEIIFILAVVCGFMRTVLGYAKLQGPPMAHITGMSRALTAMAKAMTWYLGFCTNVWQINMHANIECT